MRTVAKTATYSLMHLTVAIGVAYALTRDWRLALAVGTIEPVFQTAAFAIHERLWQKADSKKAALAFAAAARRFPFGRSLFLPGEPGELGVEARNATATV